MEPQTTDTNRVAGQIAGITSEPPKDPPTMSVEEFIAAARLLRKATGLVTESVWILRRPETHSPEHLNRLGEMSVNLSLACRHLEEAAECLGKAIQAAGVSVYDKELNDARSCVLTEAKLESAAGGMSWREA